MTIEKGAQDLEGSLVTTFMFKRSMWGPGTMQPSQAVTQGVRGASKQPIHVLCSSDSWARCTSSYHAELLLHVLTVGVRCGQTGMTSSLPLMSPLSHPTATSGGDPNLPLIYKPAPLGGSWPDPPTKHPPPDLCFPGFSHITFASLLHPLTGTIAYGFLWWF